ncbi:MAG: histidine kinase dimerization/phospho-acceptor domain-containing protein [Phycisphaerales bacterium]
MSDALTNINPRRIMHLATLGACVVLGAMGLLTWQALRLEGREQAAQARAQFQESLRLALWRIDSAMTPIIAREAARPYFEYQPFYPTKPTDGQPPLQDTSDERAVRSVDTPDGEALFPSPLLSNTDEFVNIHFQLDQSGNLTSPQVPQGRQRDLAEAGYVTPYVLSQTEDRLGELRKLTLAGNARVFEDPNPFPASGSAGQGSGTPPQRAADEPTRTGMAPPANPEEKQVHLESAAAPVTKADGDSEYQARLNALNKATTQYRQQAEEVARGQQRSANLDTRKDARARPGRDEPATREESPASSPGAPDEQKTPAAPDDKLMGPLAGPPEVPARDIAWTASDLIVQGQFAPRWLPAATAGAEPELVFVRTVRVGDQTLEQGFWINWPQLRAALLQPVLTLFPHCSIRPVDSTAPVLGRRLATIPAELVVDVPESARNPGWTPLRGVLVVVWALVIASVVAMFGIVRASIELAERRGRFVSAVTHELRTPLTTFCLYSQMLSDGMVPTEEAKRQYARTLHHESIRLTRIVESVLDFARLGRGSRAAFETLTLRELRQRAEPGLIAACARAEMRLDVSLTCDADQPVRTDPAILERVLGNLVDNACKYARNEADPDHNHIILTWSIENGRLLAGVRDFGPGIPFEEQTRVFDAFVRGRAHAHGSTPGLGLGLALSKGLAEQLGGELRIVRRDPGVEFILDIAAA